MLHVSFITANTFPHYVETAIMISWATAPGRPDSTWLCVEIVEFVQNNSYIWCSGPPLERVRRVRTHPLKSGNGCAAPVLRTPRLSWGCLFRPKIPFFMYFSVWITYKWDRRIVKQKTDTISMLKFFQNLHKTEIFGAGSPNSHPSSEDPNGAPGKC